MQKCQYILEQYLPPLAAENQIKHVQTACELDKARLGQSAQSHAARRWRIHESQLRGAIVSHICEHRRVFLKFAQGGNNSLLPNHLQANITLFPELDIYVEMVLKEQQIIIIYAHDHPEGVPRLPQ
jgi:hypothetical protein